MVKQADWTGIKQHAFEAFKRDGSLGVGELEKIFDMGCSGGEFDDQEKAMLINIITHLTGADMTAAMWEKVDKLIHKFSLEDDSEVKIESLDNDQDVVEDEP
jgi:predicted TPR repeat methyltransferase